jgi:lysophospholipid acyltransferase (LPLAT)-like uncharacterized protein
MKIRMTNRFIISPLSYLAIFVLRLILFTCRVQYINKKYIDEFILGDKKVVITTWHRCTIYFMIKYGFLHPIQGPALRAKSGLVRIAQKSGVHLMPLTWSANKVWMFVNAWDKMIIPRPFSKIVIYASEPYLIPKEAKGEEFDIYVKEMERTLNAMTRHVDTMVDHHDPNMDLLKKEEGFSGNQEQVT